MRDELQKPTSGFSFHQTILKARGVGVCTLEEYCLEIGSTSSLQDLRIYGSMHIRSFSRFLQCVRQFKHTLDSRREASFLCAGPWQLKFRLACIQKLPHYFQFLFVKSPDIRVPYHSYSEGNPKSTSYFAKVALHVFRG